MPHNLVLHLDNAGGSSANNAAPATTQAPDIDFDWVLISGFLLFLMQVGFAFI